jgi:hypothetical protein
MFSLEGSSPGSVFLRRCRSIFISQSRLPRPFGKKEFATAGPVDCRRANRGEGIAWIGFNFSHSLGVLLFAALAVWGRVPNQNAPRRHHASTDPDRLRLSGSRPALLVSHSCDRHCHWYRLLRRRLGPVAELTRRQPADPTGPRWPKKHVSDTGC